MNTTLLVVPTRLDKPWLASELLAEWQYVYHERLGLLGCFGKPTWEQDGIAKRDADAAVKKLRKEPYAKNQTGT